MSSFYRVYRVADSSNFSMQKITQVTLQLASIANDSSTSLSRMSAAGNYARKEAAS
jgi:hypothetical protein